SLVRRMSFIRIGRALSGVNYLTLGHAYDMVWLVMQPAPLSLDTPATDRPTGGAWRACTGLLRSLRPRQWPKNGLVLTALIFSVNQYWSPSNPAQVLSFGGRSIL